MPLLPRLPRPLLLPALYVFCGRHLLVAYLCRSDIDAARHSWAILMKCPG